MPILYDFWWKFLSVFYLFLMVFNNFIECLDQLLNVWTQLLNYWMFVPNGPDYRVFNDLLNVCAKLHQIMEYFECLNGF